MLLLLARGLLALICCVLLRGIILLFHSWTDASKKFSLPLSGRNLTRCAFFRMKPCAFGVHQPCAKCLLASLSNSSRDLYFLTSTIVALPTMHPIGKFLKPNSFSRSLSV